MISCPKCNSERIGRSHRRGWDRVATLLFLLPYRCRRCRCRFYRFRFQAAAGHDIPGYGSEVEVNGQPGPIVFRRVNAWICANGSSQNEDYKAGLPPQMTRAAKNQKTKRHSAA